MGFLGVHQPQTEEWLLLAFLPVLPDAVNDLHLVELAERHHVVPEIGIAEHHVIEHLPAGQQQEVKPALLFVPFRQKAIHMQQGRFPVAERCLDLCLQRRVINLERSLIGTGGGHRRRACFLKDLRRRHETTHIGFSRLNSPSSSRSLSRGPVLAPAS